MTFRCAVNGAVRSFDPAPADVAALVRELALEGKRIAVERNGEIVPRSRYADTPVEDGDRLEIIGAVGGGVRSCAVASRPVAASRKMGRMNAPLPARPPSPIRCRSPAAPIARACSSARASTRISPRRARPSTRRAPRSSPSRSAARTSARTPTRRRCSTRCRRRSSRTCPTPPAATPPTTRCARCGSRASCSTATRWSSSRCWATRTRCSRTCARRSKAAETLVKDGFQVMVYTSDDPIIARELEAIGCVAIMPLASLIGSGMGILNPWNLKLIIDAREGPGAGGRRRRHGLRCGDRDGAGLRGRADEHGDRAGAGSGADGARDAARRRGGARGVPRRPHAAQALRARARARPPPASSADGDGGAAHRRCDGAALALASAVRGHGRRRSARPRGARQGSAHRPTARRTAAG